MEKANFKYRTLKIFLFVFSRPQLFVFFYKLNKICLNAMNRVSASQLLPDNSGEKKAFEWALGRLERHQKLYFFDVGANDGDYLAMLKSICLSKKLNFSVYVFEPSSSCFALLVNDNKSATNIKLYQLALSEEDGFAKLYTPYDKSTNASLAVLDFVSTYTKNLVIEPVSTIRLDSFCEQNNIERIDFLKLDIVRI
jgi:FkbM family methyltransferase